MGVPTWDQFMAPVLRVLSDGAVRQRRYLVDAVSREVDLSDAERQMTLPSGQLTVENRIGWALSDLARSGALDRPTRGHYVLTEVGRTLLASHPNGITQQDLPPLVGGAAPLGAVTRTTGDGLAPPPRTDGLPDFALDPVEQIERGIERIHTDLAADLLSRLHAKDPAFFEQAVLDLLMAMGYGGTQGTATRTQLVNDGGIDGIVDQDALGLSRIYVQAKRYALDASVLRPEIQAFVGALHGNAANQGVYITTARFSAGAREYVKGLQARVVLIDGHRLAALMIRYGVGVQVKRVVQIVEVDEDFFE